MLRINKAVARSVKVGSLILQYIALYSYSYMHVASYIAIKGFCVGKSKGKVYFIFRKARLKCEECLLTDNSVL